jgi:hypothetical protein
MTDQLRSVENTLAETAARITDQGNKTAAFLS